MADVQAPQEGRSSAPGEFERGIAAVLYTDIDDSTGLWERHPDAMPRAIARHNALITSVVEANAGRVIKNLGDGFLALFEEPQEAVDAATAIEDALRETDWHLGTDSIRVRVAIDLGVIERRDGDIAGPAANRCSRMLEVAHGGQVLISDEVARGVEFRHPLTDLGEFPLRGVEAPVGLHRIEMSGDTGSPTVTPGWIGPTGVRSTMRGYDLRGEIGSGAAGVVYRAFQRSVGREVAIKLIKPEFANDRRFVTRFETEAQYIARLEHPHIVSLYDYWRDPDGAYLVMRWLRGGSLRDALENGPWDERATVRLLQQIGSALSYAHRHNVVHRDLRPSNVLLDEEGNGYLSDFGIASRPITVDGLSASSSPGYRSPEETAGGPLTEASDQYCLALLAYELLTGRTPDLPFEAHMEEVATTLIEQAITRATAADPSDRFPDVESFLAALEPSAIEERIVAEVSRDPFKGLRPFLESDAADFAGRDEVVEKLIDGVGRHRLVTVVGGSGSGKSSAVRAGLVPALRSGSLPGSHRWLITDMYPGSRPFDEVAMALLSVATEPFPDLVRRLRQDPAELRTAVKRITPADSELVLVIDQFEELFTLCDEATQRDFVEALVGLVSDGEARARVVLTLRADFYDRPLGFSQFAPLLDRGLVTIGASSAQELTKAITEPSENVGLVVEPALVELIVGQVVDQPGGLPLLQYTLSELFERRDHNRLTIDAFHDIGGVTGALASRADALYSGLDADDRSAVEQVFLRLVSLDDTGEPTRRRVLATELGESDAVQAVLDTYGASRLLTFDRDPVTRDPTVEVAHEALLQGWPRLADWIDRRRDDLITHRRFTLALGEWDNRDRDPAYLLSGPRLAHFETWADDTHLTLTDSERAFLTSSRAEENLLQTRRQRVRRLITAGFAIIALVASLFAVVALVQRNRAEENELAAEQARIEAEANAAEALRQQQIAERQQGIAEDTKAEAETQRDLARSRELAAAAISTIDEDPQLSILLALEAADMADPPPASIEALHEAVQSQQLIWEFEIPGPS
ncbi:MAG: protein kinase, partial [Acidimicrobiia bacterium]|nr:protein kinase [Acidimicrobiia bacterium]